MGMQDIKQILVVFIVNSAAPIFTITNVENSRDITTEMIKESIELYYSVLYKKVTVVIEAVGFGVEYATVTHDGCGTVLTWTYLKNFIF